MPREAAREHGMGVVTACGRGWKDHQDGQGRAFPAEGTKHARVVRLRPLGRPGWGGLPATAAGDTAVGSGCRSISSGGPLARGSGCGWAPSFGKKKRFPSFKKPISRHWPDVRCHQGAVLSEAWAPLRPVAGSKAGFANASA